MSKPFAFLLILIAFITGNVTMLKLVAKFFGDDAEPILKDRIYVLTSRLLYGHDPRATRTVNLKTAYDENRKRA